MDGRRFLGGEHPGGTRLTRSTRIEAYDFSGELIDTDTITVDNNGTVEPASALNLAVSELMYNPSAPTAAEVNAGFADAGPVRIHRAGQHRNFGRRSHRRELYRWHQLRSPAATDIPSGERVVLARNRAAFLSRHPGTAPFLLTGEYGIGDTNKLANGGELSCNSRCDWEAISVALPTTTNFPWPNASDGDGPSLVLIAPDTNPDHALPSNWRASAISGGNPGSSDAKSFVGDPNADLDNNGVRDLVDHALLGDGLQILTFSGSTVGFEFNRDLAADDVVVGLQVSTDLSNWTNGSELFSALDPIYLGTGGQRIRYEAQSSELPAERFFIRLQVVLTK